MTSQAATREVAHKPTDEQIACVDAIASGANVMMDALAGCAKALRNDQPVLTPTGWRPICDLQVGDKVIGKDGAPYDVLGIFLKGRKSFLSWSSLMEQKALPRQIISGQCNAPIIGRLTAG